MKWRKISNELLFWLVLTLFIIGVRLGEIIAAIVKGG